MSGSSESESKAYQARKEGSLSQARAHYEDAAKLYREQKDVLSYAHTIRHIADIYQEEGNVAPAKSLYEEALEIYRSNLNTKLLDLANTVRPCALLLEEAKWTELPDLGDTINLDFVRSVIGKSRVAAGGVVCRTPNSFPFTNGFRALPVTELASSRCWRSLRWLKAK